MDATKVGLRIQEVRKSRGLTQAELAQTVDITPKYLSNVECGSKIPKMTTFIAIANALEVDANTLLADVLNVSKANVSIDISNKLALLSPQTKRRIQRLFDLIVQDAMSHPD